MKRAVDDGCARSRYRPIMEMRLQTQPCPAQWYRLHTDTWTQQSHSQPQCHSKAREQFTHNSVYVCVRAHIQVLSVFFYFQLPGLKTGGLFSQLLSPGDPKPLTCTLTPSPLLSKPRKITSNLKVFTHRATEQPNRQRTTAKAQKSTPAFVLGATPPLRFPK